MNFKYPISHLLRRVHLIYFTDFIRFYFQRCKNYRRNRQFTKAFPQITLPPDYLLYESFQMSYTKYYWGGRDTASWFVNLVHKHLNSKPENILDWGCGPARILRHLPDFYGLSCYYFGTDYNRKTIAWCQQNIPSIHFNRNNLEPILPYEEHFFDLIYGISIFTHLSEEMHFGWQEELRRILKPGGLLFLTTQGDPFKEKLTENELKKYENGELVVRGNVKEGHRTFSAFHPRKFMQRLFQDMKIEEHIVSQPEKGKWLPQDVWILRK